MTTRRLVGGYELDDDPARVDVDAVYRFLSTEAYWALGRTRDHVERLVLGATRVVGLYLGAEQVGFCRAVTDDTAFAYLADVYVLHEHRGRGLGEELVREMIERGPYDDRTWILHTKDMHRLYAKLGFGPPSARLLERPRRSS